MRWMRDNFSLFLPVLAFTISIAFGVSTHQKALAVLFFWNAWKLKNQADLPASRHTKVWQKRKTIFGIPRLGMNPTWCSGQIFLNCVTWLHRPMTWAQKMNYSIFLGYRTSEFCDMTWTFLKWVCEFYPLQSEKQIHIWPSKCTLVWIVFVSLR